MSHGVAILPPTCTSGGQFVSSLFFIHAVIHCIKEE